MTDHSFTLPPLLAIGVGNESRGDDGAGAEVCRRLQSLVASDFLETRIVHQLTPEMAEWFIGRQAIYIIDASVDIAPGRTRIRRVRPVDKITSLGHRIDIAELLGLAKVCFDANPMVWTVELGATDFDFEEQLSPPLHKAIQRLIGRVADRSRPSKYNDLKIPAR